MAEGPRSGYGVEVKGLLPLLKKLNGREFRQVNSELRDQARFIADGIVPEVKRAVVLSRAPQAEDFVRTVASKRDRIPVVVIGSTNPTLTKFSRRGPRKDGRPRQTGPWRKGAMAYGIVFGPAGKGKRTAPPSASGWRNPNYKIARNESGGAVMRSIHSGPAFRAAAREYAAAYKKVLRRNGFKVR